MEREAITRLRSLPFLVNVMLVGVTYFCVAKLSLLLAFVQMNASPLWPPVGLAVAVTVVVGPRMAVGVALGAIAVNATTNLPWWAAAGMGIGNGLEALTASLLLRRLGFNPALDRNRDFLVLAGVAPTAALVSVMFGVGALTLAGEISSKGAVGVGLIWWIGNVLGVYATTPVILTFSFRAESVAARRRLEKWLFSVVFIVVATGAFFATYHSGVTVMAGLLTPILFLGWAAARFGTRGAALAVAADSLLAVAAVAAARGPFVWLAASQTERSVSVEIFIALMSISTLTLAAVFAERRRLESALHATSRLAQLSAEVSAGLVEAGLDVRDTARRLARGIVESVGDACSVNLLDGLGATLDPVAIESNRPDFQRSAREIVAAMSPSTDNGLHAEALREGDAVAAADMPAEELRSLTRPEFPPYMDTARLSALRVIPLRDRHRAIGTIGVCRLAPSPPYTDEELRWLRDLAGRAGLALANSCLFSEQELAKAQLQRLLDVTEAILGHTSHQALVQALPPRIKAVLAVDTVRLYLLDADGRHLTSR